MLNQYDKEQLAQLTATNSKRTVLNELRDMTKQRHNELLRDVNRCQAVSGLFASQEFQHVLDNTIERVQEFKVVQQDYEKLPENNELKIQKLQLSNQDLEMKVWQLQQRISREREREERIENSLQTCEETINQLFAKKSDLEYEITSLKAELDHNAYKRAETLADLQSLNNFAPEQLELLREQKIDDLIFNLSMSIKAGNVQQQRTLVQLAQRILILQQLRNKHEEAQKLFSNYSNCQSEHDLIAEEKSLFEEINTTKQMITKQKQIEEQARADCEERVKREAVKHTQQWITMKLLTIYKKKKSVIALLDMVVVDDEEGRQDIREIKNELWKLEEEEKTFKEKLKQNGIEIPQNV